MPCDSVVVGDSGGKEESVEVTSVNFTAGQNSGSFDFTIKNTGDVGTDATIDIIATNANTDEQLEKKTRGYHFDYGMSFSRTVSFNFSFSSQTDVKVCANVTNVGEGIL